MNMPGEFTATIEKPSAANAATGPLSAKEYAELAEHGRRVRKHGGRFP